MAPRGRGLSRAGVGVLLRSPRVRLIRIACGCSFTFDLDTIRFQHRLQARELGQRLAEQPALIGVENLVEPLLRNLFQLQQNCVEIELGMNSFRDHQHLAGCRVELDSLVVRQRQCFLGSDQHEVLAGLRAIRPPIEIGLAKPRQLPRIERLGGEAVEERLAVKQSTCDPHLQRLQRLPEIVQTVGLQPVTQKPLPQRPVLGEEPFDIDLRGQLQSPPLGFRQVAAARQVGQAHRQLALQVPPPFVGGVHPPLPDPGFEIRFVNHRLGHLPATPGTVEIIPVVVGGACLHPRIFPPRNLLHAHFDHFLGDPGIDSHFHHHQGGIHRFHQGHSGDVALDHFPLCVLRLGGPGLGSRLVRFGSGRLLHAHLLHSHSDGPPTNHHGTPLDQILFHGSLPLGRLGTCSPFRRRLEACCGLCVLLTGIGTLGRRRRGVHLQPDADGHGHPQSLHGNNLGCRRCAGLRLHSLLLPLLPGSRLLISRLFGVRLSVGRGGLRAPFVPLGHGTWARVGHVGLFFVRFGGTCLPRLRIPFSWLFGFRFGHFLRGAHDSAEHLELLSTKTPEHPNVVGRRQLPDLVLVRGQHLFQLVSQVLREPVVAIVLQQFEVPSIAGLPVLAQHLLAPSPLVGREQQCAVQLRDQPPDGRQLPSLFAGLDHRLIPLLHFLVGVLF